MLPNAVSLVSNAIQISGLLHWRKLSSQLGSIISTRTIFGPVPVLKTQIIGHIRKDVS